MKCVASADIEKNGPSFILIIGGEGKIDVLAFVFIYYVFGS